VRLAVGAVWIAQDAPADYFLLERSRPGNWNTQNQIPEKKQNQMDRRVYTTIKDATLVFFKER
jgi:hypothetical protein